MWSVSTRPRVSGMDQTVINETARRSHHVEGERGRPEASRHPRLQVRRRPAEDRDGDRRGTATPTVQMRVGNSSRMITGAMAHGEARKNWPMGQSLSYPPYRLKPISIKPVPPAYRWLHDHSIKDCSDGSAPLVHRPVLQNEAPVRQQSTKISPQPEASLLSYPAAIPLSQRTLIQLPGSEGGRG